MFKVSENFIARMMEQPDTPSQFRRFSDYCLPVPESVKRSRDAARRLSVSISHTSLSVMRRTSSAVKNNVAIIVLPTLDEVFERERTDLHDADDLLRLLGNPGRFQLIQYLLLCLQFLAYMSDFAPVFFNLPPLGISYPNQSLLLHDGGEGSKDFNITDVFVPFNQLKSIRSCHMNGLDIDHLPVGIQYVYPHPQQRSIIADVRSSEITCSNRTLRNVNPTRKRFLISSCAHVSAELTIRQ